MSGLSVKDETDPKVNQRRRRGSHPREDGKQVAQYVLENIIGRIGSIDQSSQD